jgi:hypothetical protein
MEHMDKKCETCMGGSCEGGNCCGMHMHGYHDGKFHLVKMLLKLIIVMIIFFFGFKLGMLTGFINAEYGRDMTGFGGGWGMMRGYNPNVSLPSVPAR